MRKILVGTLVLFLVLGLTSGITYGMFDGFRFSEFSQIWGSVRFGIFAFAIYWIPLYIALILFIAATKSWVRVFNALNGWRYSIAFISVCAIGLAVGAIITRKYGAPQL